MGDSGLDLGSCYFSDPMVPLPGPTHRKVVSYRQAVGDAIDASGHGTHVAGSFVGAVLANGEAGKWNGMAPGARLAFTDFGVVGELGSPLNQPGLASGNPLCWEGEQGTIVKGNYRL